MLKKRELNYDVDFGRDRCYYFYRRQKSYATLQEANDAMKDAHWNLTIQRLYYAVYYMASALLLKNKIPAQSHNGVVGQIGLHFVTTGRLSKEYGRLYSRLLQSRILSV